MFQNAVPHVVCVGYEKCGTTTLDSIFRASDKLALPRDVKETHFFGRHYEKGLDYYNALFEIASTTRYTVDVTPSYVRSRKALERIKRDCDHRTKIILCLRNPVYRAYSHYIHDIHHHFGPLEVERFGGQDPLTQPYETSFFDEDECRNDYHFTRYGEACRELFELFGRDNVLILILEEDMRDRSLLAKKIRSFLGVNLKMADPNPQIKNQGRLPYYVYSESKDTDIDVGGNSFTCDKGKLYLVRNRNVLDLEYRDTETARRIVEASTRWTRELSAASAERIFEMHFADDVENLQVLTGRQLDCWRVFHDVRY